jgi:hypothetical protein
MNRHEDEQYRIEGRIEQEPTEGEQQKKITTAIVLGLIIVGCMAYIRRH